MVTPVATSGGSADPPEEVMAAATSMGVDVSTPA
jgi:hypothetical protein